MKKTFFSILALAIPMALSSLDAGGKVPSVFPEDCWGVYTWGSWGPNDVNRRIFLGLLTKAMKGTHIYSQHASMRVSRQIVIQIDDPAPMYVDGEMFAYPEDNIQQVTVTSLPKAIQLLA